MFVEGYGIQTCQDRRMFYSLTSRTVLRESYENLKICSNYIKGGEVVLLNDTSSTDDFIKNPYFFVAEYRGKPD